MSAKGSAGQHLTPTDHKKKQSLFITVRLKTLKNNFSCNELPEQICFGQHVIRLQSAGHRFQCEIIPFPTHKWNVSTIPHSSFIDNIIYEYHFHKSITKKAGNLLSDGIYYCPYLWWKYDVKHSYQINLHFLPTSNYAMVFSVSKTTVKIAE